MDLNTFEIKKYQNWFLLNKWPPKANFFVLLEIEFLNFLNNCIITLFKKYGILHIYAYIYMYVYVGMYLAHIAFYRLDNIILNYYIRCTKI